MKNSFVNFIQAWKVNDWILSLLLFFCIFNIKITSILIVSLLISIFFNRKYFSDAFKILFSYKKPFLWMILFFLYHVIGMFWSTNSSFGWADIGMKMSFLLIPFILVLGKFEWTLKKTIQFLIFSQVITVLFLLILAAFKSIYYPEDNHWGYFFESEFSVYMHRSYFATYTTMGAIASFFSFWNSQNKKWYLFASVLLCIATILTLSKAGIVLLVLSFSLAFIWLIFKKRMYILGSLFFTGIVLAILFLLFSNSRFSSRLKDVGASLSKVQTTNNSSVESNAARIVMWSTSLKVIPENLILGSGTGDVKDILYNKNRELKNDGVAEKNFNSHNQYLNTTVQLGLLGLIFLGGILVTAFRNALQLRNLIQFFVVLIFSITFLFESFLETQAGIIPFCLIIAMLFGLKKEVSINRE